MDKNLKCWLDSSTHPAVQQPCVSLPDGGLLLFLLPQVSGQGKGEMGWHPRAISAPAVTLEEVTRLPGPRFLPGDVERDSNSQPGHTLESLREP